MFKKIYKIFTVLLAGFAVWVITPWITSWLRSVQVSTLIDAVSIANIYIIFTTIIFVSVTVILAIAEYVFTQQFSATKRLQESQLIDELKEKIKNDKRVGIVLVNAILDSPDIIHYLDKHLLSKIGELIQASLADSKVAANQAIQEAGPIEMVSSTTKNGQRIVMSETEHLFSNATMLLTYLKEEKGFDIKAPVNVDKIATELGILVESDFSLEPKDIVGEIFFKAETPIVKINPIQNFYSPRRRFTLAHEIGHFCLHSAKSKKGFMDSQKTMNQIESYWDSYESEANNFAAQLLMPKSLILDEGQRIINIHKEKTGVKETPVQFFIEAMADKFEVSSKAMEYRLQNIGIVR